jgi:hypothetical protein
MATRAAMATPELPTTAHETDRQPMLHDEQIGRAQSEHDDRVPVEPVTQPAPSGSGQVLAHGQRVDVSDSAAIEIA